jgi:hypothetical protein
MSDQDEPKANERDSDSDEDRDSDAEVESEREPEPAAAKKVAAKGRAGGKRPDAARKAPASKGASGSNVGVFILLALLAGGAAGYFGHMQQAKAAAAKADATAPVGSAGKAAGPCGAWEKKICGSSGEQSAACMQAKGATELLAPSACEAALATVPATLTKLKAARASCEKLVSKLCTDLPPGSQMCAMVKEKTPAFPAQRCDEMLQHYDEVIAQLKQMEEQQGMMGGPGGPGHGGPGGPGGPGMSAPPGMPPH